MRLGYAATGDLERFFLEEIRDGKVAVTRGVGEAAEDLVFDLRNDVLAAGLGARLSKSWRVSHYPKGNVSLRAASVVKTKAPKLIDAFEEGAMIRSTGGVFLAVPTEAAPKRGLGRKRISPSNWPENRYGPLRFVYRKSGPSLLVADDQRLSRGKRGGYVRSRSKRALATGNGLSTVIMFLLYPQVRLRRRLNVKSIADRAGARVVDSIDREYRRLGARKGK